MKFKRMDQFKRNCLNESATHDEIKSWLDEMEIENYTINKDGIVDVNGDVDITYEGLTSIPVQFGKVTGNFLCHHNKLTSLRGCPKIVGSRWNRLKSKVNKFLEPTYDTPLGKFYVQTTFSSFNCEHNPITSLIGGPVKVDGNYSCGKSKLTSLEGLPDEVGGNFYCEKVSGFFDINDFIDININGKLII